MNRLAYTYAQAAELVGVSEWTIRRMVDSGDLSVVRFRKSPRITHEALTAYLSSEKKNTPCLTVVKTRPSGGYRTPTQAASELGNLLGLPTERKRRR